MNAFAMTQVTNIFLMIFELINSYFQPGHNKWYIVDPEVNTVSMIPNMTGFEITEVSGHTAAVGHT